MHKIFISLITVILTFHAGKAMGKVYNVPFTDNFGSSNHLSDFVIIDGNNDGNKWHLNTTWNIFGGDRSLEEMRLFTMNGADDWFVTPALHLEAGYVYAISFNTHCGDYRYSEKMEICLGTEPTVESLSTVVMQPFTFNNYEYETFTKDFSVSETGDYRLAFHAISGAGSSDIFLDDVSVKLSSTPLAPASVTDFSATPDPAGKHICTLNFTAPSTTIGGEALTDITKISVLRNRTVVGTINNPEVGSAVEYVDKAVPNGYVSYSIIAYNTAGKGVTYDSDPVYVGVDVPQKPANARIIDNGNSVTISWDPVTSIGEHGMVVDPSTVIYAIHEYDFAGDLSNRIYYGSETSATINYNTSNGDPDLAKWAVIAHSDAGDSGISNVRLAVGKQYRLPYVETFRLAKRSTLIWTEQQGKRYFSISSADCADGDGASARYIPYADGDMSSLCTGKISLRGSADPMLRFKYKAAQGSTIDVIALTADGTETLLSSFSGEGDDSSCAWNTAKVALQQMLSADYVVIKLRAKGMAESPIFIDNIRISDLYPVDLDVQISAPEAVEWGEDITVAVTVNNVGAEDVSAFELVLTATAEGYESPAQVINVTESLPSMASAVYTFTLPSSAIPTDYVNIMVEANAPGDLSTGNNIMSAIVGVDNNQSQTDGIMSVQQKAETFNVYSLDGRCTAVGARSMDALPSGLYIINNHVVKK